MTAVNLCTFGALCDYQVPDDYNPSLNSENADWDEATKILHNCRTIWNNHVYYVGSDDQLHGYSWINFPMRLLLAVKNRLKKGTIEHDAVQKITETFDKVLNINAEHALYTFTTYSTLHNTHFMISESRLVSYDDIGERVITKFPKEKYPELYEKTHRILHERRFQVKVMDGSEEKLIFNSKSGFREESTKMPYPYNITTVWESC